MPCFLHNNYQIRSTKVYPFFLNKGIEAKIRKGVKCCLPLHYLQRPFPDLSLYFPFFPDVWIDRIFLLSSQKKRKSLMNNNVSDRVLTIKDVAELFHREQSTIRKRMCNGQLPGRKVGRSWYVLESELFDTIRSV